MEPAQHQSPSGIVGGGPGHKYRFTVVDDGLLRMEWASDCVFEDRLSTFAICRDNRKPVKYEVREDDDTLQIITSRFHLNYNKREFSDYGLYALVFGFTRSLWRFKEPQPNLKGTYRTLDNIDGRLDRETGQTIELELGVVSRKGYALLDDSSTMLFDDKGFIAPRRPVDGLIDCYLFAYGHDYREAIKALYRVSGPTPVLPRWALGNWWSRYNDYTAESYLELMDRFGKQGIPLSVAVLDMDWHLVNDKRVIDAGQTGWTGYTSNKELFPDPPEFIRQLHQRGLKTALNDHPADGIHSYEDRYEDIAKFLGLDVSKKAPIPFEASDETYLKAYFDIVLKALEDDGCDFWWIDWQQGAFSRLKGVDPLWVLNHYHFLHNQKAKPESLPMIFSRYAGPGSHRYVVGFSGDTYTTWSSLAFQPEFTATASNIGYGWWSHDIGGHMLGVKDDELTTRWVQLGVLSPIMRLHSTQNRWVTKEPWRLPHEPRTVIADFLRLRHRLIPYLMTMNYRAAFEGEPLVQPMYWQYPENDEAYRFPNQYFFGTQMIVMPITMAGDPALRLGRVKGWLPPGQYVDFFTGLPYDGGCTLWVSRPLAQYPVFLRTGSIVPLDADPEPKNGGLIHTHLELTVVVRADGFFELLEEPEDDVLATAQGRDWNRTPINYTQATGRIEVGPSSSGKHQRRSWSIRLLGYLCSESTVQASSADANLKIEVAREDSATLLKVGDVAESGKLTVDIGRDPKLTPSPLLELVEPVLQQAQIEYDIKDKVWAILSEKGVPMASRLASIQALEASENLMLYLVECMSAMVNQP